MWKQEMRLFKSGVKPAILVKHKTKDYYYGQDDTTEQVVREEMTGYESLEFKELNGHYPSMEFPVRNGVMFFHTEESMQEFKEKVYHEMEQLGETVVDCDSKIMGDALGYPPMATEAWDKYFMHDHKNKTLMKKGSINYYGMKFLCLPEDVDDCINWLKENRPVPDEISDKADIHVSYQESRPNILRN